MTALPWRLKSHQCHLCDVAATSPWRLLTEFRCSLRHRGDIIAVATLRRYRSDITIATSGRCRIATSLRHCEAQPFESPGGRSDVAAMSLLCWRFCRCCEVALTSPARPVGDVALRCRSDIAKRNHLGRQGDRTDVAATFPEVAVKVSLRYRSNVAVATSQQCHVCDVAATSPWRL